MCKKRGRGRGRPNVKKGKRYTPNVKWELLGMNWLKRGMEPKGYKKHLEKYKNTGSVKDLPKSGRPRKTTVRDDRHMEIKTAQNPRITATQMAKRIALLVNKPYF